MANHGWVLTPNKLTKDDVLRLVKDVVLARWGDALSVTSDKFGNVFVNTSEHNPRHLWLDKPKRIALTHRGGSDPVAGWVDAVVLNDLALATGGMVGDESDDDQAPGEPGKYPTLLAYLTAIEDYGLREPKDIRHMECLVYRKFQDAVHHSKGLEAFFGEAPARPSDYEQWVEDSRARLKALIGEEQYKKIHGEGGS